MLAVVLIGAIIGLVNGFFVAKFSLHPFIVTLATQLITYGLILIFFMLNGNNGQPVSGLSQEYKNVVSAPLIQFTTGSGAKISIPWYVLYAVLFVALMWFIWNKTAFGKNMFAVGSNADAAKVSGVNVFWTTGHGPYPCGRHVRRDRLHRGRAHQLHHAGRRPQL